MAIEKRYRIKMGDISILDTAIKAAGTSRLRYDRAHVGSGIVILICKRTFFLYTYHVGRGISRHSETSLCDPSSTIQHMQYVQQPQI